MIRAIIVDDVAKIRESTSILLKKYCPEVTIVAEAENVAQAQDVILEHKPDLLFLDIEMPDGTGFDLLQKLSPFNFKVIFVTAYDHYAVKAFKFSAIDYLVKPIDRVELINAVSKAKELINKSELDVKLQTLFSNVSGNKFEYKKIILRTAEYIYSVDVNDIIRCESDQYYTTFYLTNGHKHIVSTTLKEYDELLSPQGFFRTHQSHLINMLFFSHFVKADGGVIVLKDNTKVPISVRKKAEFLQKIGG